MYFEIVFLVVLCATSCHGQPSENSTNNDTIHRLSDDVIPLSYILKIAPNIENPIYEGSINISVKIKNPTHIIKLHSKELIITKHEVTDGNRTIDHRIHLDRTNDLLVIELQKELQAERTCTVVINFLGILTGAEENTVFRTHGFFKRHYRVEKTKKWLAVTNFEPTYARSAFPCFDEPKYKATFKIYIERDIHHTALSNMPLRETTNSSINNRVWDEFETSPPISTHFVAFMVSEFTHIDASNRSVSLWVPEGTEHKFNYAFRQELRCLEKIETMVGISYPLQKLDIAVIPEFYHAMGNWGLNTIEQLFLKFNENSTDWEKRYTVQTECRVIANMWFGNLVTPAWWDNLWLKEGFGTYFAYFATREIEPSLRTDEWFIVDIVQYSLWVDIRADRAMTKKVEIKSHLQDINDDVTYRKGATVIRMLEHILTPAVFRTFINNFLITGRDKLAGIVTQNNFLNVLEEEVKTHKTSLPPNITISQIMKSWTENRGYPLITVTRDSDSQMATITQTTYKSCRTRAPPPDQKWIIPLTYTTSDSSQFTNTTPTIWSLSGKPLKINVTNGNWVFCNLLESGYYRVNYDTYNWQLLITQLLTDHQKIPAASRTQLIDDAFNLAYDGVIPYLIPLQILLYLPKERDPIPLFTAQLNINRLITKLNSTNTNTSLKQYIQLIIKNQYEILGFKPKPEEDMSTRWIRPKILQLACAAELPACIENALDEYKHHKDDISKIHPDLKQTVFQTALRHANDLQNIQNQLLSFYEKTDDEFDKDAVLVAAVNDGNRTFLKKILSRTTKQQLMEKVKKPRNIDLLTASKISLAYLQYKYGDRLVASRVTTNDIILIETLLAKIELGTQTDELLSLLRKFKISLAKFKQRYTSVMESIDHLYVTSLKLSREIPNTATKLKSILMNILTTYPDNILYKLI